MARRDMISKKLCSINRKSVSLDGRQRHDQYTGKMSVSAAGRKVVRNQAKGQHTGDQIQT